MDNNVILLCEYGSRAHGTDTEFSDHDKMGIYVEPIEAVLGIQKVDTIQASTAKKGDRSGSGDTDTTLYPLRKWAGLAAHGNPTVLTPLFVSRYEEINNSGQMLVDARDLFISKEAGRRFLGYMLSQRDAMVGLRNKKTNRPELVHQFGYDTKFAYHMIRLGILGTELMNSGRMTLPMRSWAIGDLMAIREGRMTKDEVLDWSKELEDEIAWDIKKSHLPDKPDIPGINKLLIDIQTYEWGDD